MRRRPPIHGPTPPFVMFGTVFVLCMLLATCARAEATAGERESYRIGVVAGAYYAHVKATMLRLFRAGVPQNKLVSVYHEGCHNVTLEEVAAAVLLQPPLPKNEGEIVLQTHELLDRACASLSEVGT